MILNFSQFIKENNSEKVIMKKLISNDGKVLDIKGESIEGVGIFDEENNEYPAGIDENDIIHVEIETTSHGQDCCYVDENSCVLIKAGQKYNNESEFEVIYNTPYRK